MSMWRQRSSATIVMFALTGAVTLLGVSIGAATAGAAARTVYESGMIGLAVPDGDSTGVSHVITVPEGGAIADLDVEVRIQHERAGELDVELVAPDGVTRRVLASRSGGSADGYGGADADCRFGFVRFSDDSQNDLPSDGSELWGAYRPAEPLSALDGRDAGGGWTLTVRDQSSGDSGQIACWRLIVTRAVQPAGAVPRQGTARMLAGVSLGVRQEQVEALWGAPSDDFGVQDPQWHFNRYVRDGRTIGVEYWKRVAITVSTASPAFKLPRGLTVGIKVPRSVWSNAGRWRGYRFVRRHQGCGMPQSKSRGTLVRASGRRELRAYVNRGRIHEIQLQDVKAHRDALSANQTDDC